MKLNKKEASDEFWIRLLKDKLLEKTNVTVDWDRYVDEDDDGTNFNTIVVCNYYISIKNDYC